MTIRTRVRLDKETPIQKRIRELDTTVSRPKDRSKPTSNDIAQPEKKNLSKESSKAKWTQPSRKRLLYLIGLAICVAILAWRVHEDFYSTPSNQEQSQSTRAFPGPITLMVDQPGIYTLSENIEQPGTYVWDQGVLATQVVATQFVTTIVPCCRTASSS